MKKRLKNLNKFVAKLTGENYLWRSLFWSSLIYNMSARQERHECDTSATQATRVWHERRDSDTSETIARHYWDTSDTSAARVQECDTNDTSVTGVKNFDFENGTKGNIFSHPDISYVTNETLQGEEDFYFKNYLLEMCHCNCKMCLKNAPQ